MRLTLRYFSLILLTALFLNCSATKEEDMLSYGAFVKGNKTIFKLLAPRADGVYLVIFERPEDEAGSEYPMEKNSDGIWELGLRNAGYGTYYGYRLEGPLPIDPAVIVADPYSKAAVTQN
ncbi:MAG: hypothetical protein HQ528_08830, partial [Candidatus Marinimicrobia bacterium]|nr:hypothetical protein [Candidatus Neomarinimicrobiota bacterium]